MGKELKYNTIFFDAGCVLFDTPLSRSERISNILMARGFNDKNIEKAIAIGNEFALNSLGVMAEECLFIDDKLKNVESAMKIGFKGLYLDRKTDNLRVLLK